ncbi:MAG: hypothetical protein RMK49_21255, partial [Abditibacteriales bacterium]|nr:hypothetical protein [Abditibacteriales bacterium]
MKFNRFNRSCPIVDRGMAGGVKHLAAASGHPAASGEKGFVQRISTWYNPLAEKEENVKFIVPLLLMGGVAVTSVQEPGAAQRVLI